MNLIDVLIIGAFAGGLAVGLLICATQRRGGSGGGT